MAKNGKKTFGIPNKYLIVILIAVAGGVGFYVYRKKGQREAMRARAFNRTVQARMR